MNSKEKIIENLKDSGCNDNFIERFMKIPENQYHMQIFMLEKHRKKVLDDYHKDVKKLDCLDYLIYKITRRGGGNL